MAGSDDRGLDLRLPWGRPKAAPGPERPEEPERPDRAGDAGPERPDRAGDERRERPERDVEPERPRVVPERPDAARRTEHEKTDRATGGGRKRRRGGGAAGDVTGPQERVVVQEPAVVEREREREREPEREREREGDGPGPGVPLGLSSEPLEVTNARAAAEAAKLDDRLQRLQLGIASRFDRLEEQAEAHDAGLDARLEKLEARLEAAHAASIEAVGLLAGQVVARLEEQVASLEATIQSRHEELVGHVELALETRHEGLLAKIDSVHVSTMEAVADVASGKLVERLLEGVVALGEVLDADLINLRRLLTDPPRSGATTEAPTEAIPSQDLENVEHAHKGEGGPEG